MHDLYDLKLAIRNLISMYGSTDNPIIGIAVSLGLAIPGVLVWWFFSGWVAFLGVVWVLINLLPIVQWVLGL